MPPFTYFAVAVTHQLLDVVSLAGLSHPNSTGWCHLFFTALKHGGQFLLQVGG